MKRLLTATAVVLTLALTGCASTSDSAATKGDALARAACTHWRNIADDVQAGVLTDAELREKLKEVRDSAQYSEYKPVRKAATELLASITGDVKRKEVGKAVAAMIEACAPVGDYMGDR
jgi:hypothetical protein